MNKRDILSNINVDIFKESKQIKKTTLNDMLNDIPMFAEIYPKKEYIKIPKVLEVQKKIDTPVVIDPSIEKRMNKAVKINDAILEKESQKGIMYYCKKFYNKWISPNKVMIIFLIILIVVLYYRYDSNTQSNRNLQQTVNRITDQSIKIKRCGHRYNQPCLCNSSFTQITPQQHINNPRTVSKETILSSINNMPNVSPIITSQNINNQHQQSNFKTHDSMFKHNDFSWCAPNTPHQDANMYMNNYIMKPYSN